MIVRERVDALDMNQTAEAIVTAHTGGVVQSATEGVVSITCRVRSPAYNIQPRPPAIYLPNYHNI